MPVTCAEYMLPLTPFSLALTGDALRAEHRAQSTKAQSTGDDEEAREQIGRGETTGMEPPAYAAAERMWPKAGDAEGKGPYTETEDRGPRVYLLRTAGCRLGITSSLVVP